MTWFGKILAVLNIVATLAFVYLACQDYAKREAWAYANYVHDVAVNGLPLDDKVTDDHESPLLNRLGAETKNEWFASNGGPVATQVAEVDRVKGLVDAKISALNDDPVKQTVEYARILTPFARHNTEREWLLGVRTYLASPDEAAKLNKRLHDAFPAAVQAYQARPDDRTFPEAFENACHALGGIPARAFEENFVKLLPAKPEKTFEGAVKAAQAVKVAMGATPEQEAHDRAVAFLADLRGEKVSLRQPGEDPAKNKDALDDVFAQALTAVHDQLKVQLDGLFDEALTGPASFATPTTHIREAQHRAIAHLLFNMVEVLLPEGAAEKGVFASPDYIRFVYVVGLSAAVREINEQADRLQLLGEELQSARRLERGEFAAAHRVLIDELQGLAVTLQYSIDLLEKKKQQLADEEAVVMRRKDDVKQAEDKLSEARTATDKQMKELREKSDSLHKMRIEGRDLLGENLELERQIRGLEKNR